MNFQRELHLARRLLNRNQVAFARVSLVESAELEAYYTKAYQAIDNETQNEQDARLKMDLLQG